MSSEVKANKVSPATGTDFTFGDSGDTFTVPSGATLTNSGTASGFGKVLQVVSAVKTDTASTTSITFVTTGLEVSITPSATSSKILIIATPYLGGIAAAGPGDGWGICLLRDTTELNLGDAMSARTRYGADGRANNVTNTTGMAMSYLDSPSSTSSITYKVAYRNASTTNTLYLNRTYEATDNSSFGTASSTITVMEIEG